MNKEVNTASILKDILDAQKTAGELPPVEKWNPPLCENVETVSYTHLTLPTNA